MTLTPLSDAALHQQDLRAAERYATEAVQLAMGTGWEAAALVRYAVVLKERGELDAARAASVRALRVALHAGLENWFRMGLRELARMAAERDRHEDAVVFLAASRKHAFLLSRLPGLRTDRGAMPRRARPGRFDELAEQGEAMTHDQLMDLAGADDLRTAPAAG